MHPNLIRKELVFVTSILFILTSLSSVYAGFNLESNTTEISKFLRNEHEVSNHYNENEKLRDRCYNYHPSRNITYSKPTFIDGEDWDIVVPDNFTSIQEAIDNISVSPETGYRI